LLFEAESIGEVVNEAKKGMMRLSEWCKHNRLFINWSKTFVMFVSNKHKLNIPKEVKVDDVSIQVVEEFKLLGVMIDNKLNFEKLLLSKVQTFIKGYTRLKGYSICLLM
jgi:hypothetical protein